MSIKVYNTLTKQKEEFVPIHPGKANIYVCGVTPYNHPHVGNARPFVTWDVIRRFLEHEGYDVTHVQNFTDVDDKIINTANKEGVQWYDICNRYIDSYFEVMDKLNVRRAHVYPRVSEHIDDIIKTVQCLIDNGYGYVVDGDVFYSVEKFKYYGQLSGRNIEDMMAGARVTLMTASIIRWILRCGNQLNRASLLGRALGVPVVQAGILNVYHEHEVSGRNL